MKPQGFIEPKYQVISNFKGGLDLSAPADQIPDDAFQDVLNLQYINGVLQVDTGYKAYGKLVAGFPLQPIQYKLTNGQYQVCLVTTAAFYLWDTGTQDWSLLMPTLSASTTITGVVAGTPWGSSFSSSFGPLPLNNSAIFEVASATGLAANQVIQVPYSSPAGLYYTSVIVSITGTTLTCETPVLAGSTIAAGAALKAYASYYGGQFPISWTVDPTRNALIWTNGVDPVQDFSDGTIGPLEGLSTIANTARIVGRFYGYTLALGTTEGGTLYPYRFRYSTPVSSQQWNPATYSAAGYNDLTDTSGSINSLSFVGGNAVIGKDDSLILCSFWGTASATWFFQTTIGNTGVIGGNGMAQSKDKIVLTSSSGVYEYLGDYTLHDVGDNVYNYFLGPLGNLDPTNQENLFHFYNSQYDEMWVFYPTKGYIYCNNLLRYSLKYKNWFVRSLGTQIGGASIGFNETASTWAQTLGTWQQQNYTWTQRSYSSSYPKILLADVFNYCVWIYDYLVQTDNGVTISWYLITKDYPVLQEKLTLDGVACFARGTALFEVSTDGQVTWLTIGTMVFGPALSKQTLDFQVTGDFFTLRISGTDPTFQLADLAPRYLDAAEY